VAIAPHFLGDLNVDQFVTSTRTKIIYGAIALLPIVAIAYIGFELFSLISGAVAPLMEHLGANPLINLILLVLLTIAVLLVFCYFCGVLIATRIGAMSFDKVEARVRKLVPGYEIVARLARGMVGDKGCYTPALVTLGAPGTAVLGFLMEEDDGNPYLTVFVPSAPVITIGSIHVVERSRVQRLEGTAPDAANCLTQWGLGLQKFRGTVEPIKAISGTNA
jgi:uncharacterized membrane protein